MSYSLDYLSNNETRRELMNKVALYLNSYSNEWRDRKAIKLEDIYTLWLISLSIGLFGSEKNEEYYHLGSEILLRLKIILENTASPSPSFFGGLADVSFAIIQFNKTTGGYSRFSDQVYKYCVALIKEYSQQCIDQLHDVRFSVRCYTYLNIIHTSLQIQQRNQSLYLRSEILLLFLGKGRGP